MFLCFYLSSYFLYGDRSSGLAPGPLRTSYFLLLASHVILAMAIAGRLEINRTLVRPEDFMPYLEGLSRMDVRVFTAILAAAAVAVPQDASQEPGRQGDGSEAGPASP